MEKDRALNLLQNGLLPQVHGAYHDALEMAIEALQTEPCEDCVSRQEVIEQTYNWSQDEFLRVTNPFDYLRRKIKALPPITLQPKKGEEWKQQPCNDCISRQQALDTFGLSEKSRKYGGDHSGYDTIMLYEVQDALEALPSVQPEQKMGKWIIVDDCERFIAKCSECGRIEDSRMISKYPYCHCGAKMESEDKK